MADGGSAGARWADGAVELGMRRCSRQGGPLALSPREGHDRGTRQLKLPRSGSLRRRGGAAGLCLAAEPILAKLVQLGRLTGELLAAGRVDPLQPRDIRVGDRTRRRGGELVQRAGQHQVRRRRYRVRSGRGAGSQPPRLGERVRRAGLGVLAAVAVDFVQLVRPARVGAEVLRRGVCVERVITVAASVEGVPRVDARLEVVRGVIVAEVIRAVGRPDEQAGEPAPRSPGPRRRVQEVWLAVDRLREVHRRERRCRGSRTGSPSSPGWRRSRWASRSSRPGPTSNRAG